VKRRAAVPDPAALAEEIANLPKADIKNLRECWKALYGKAPSVQIGRSFLVRAIAYRLQAQAFDGLKPATCRLLARIADEAATTNSPKRREMRKAATGTILVREWQGNAHRVTVLNDGVAFNGKRYRSLSEVAMKSPGAGGPDRGSLALGRREWRTIMERLKSPVRRCAIYTRKSSEEGLEQDFNSLHAQREACEAFIKSQAGEGWRLIRTAYDDGGLSGGTMERPALQRMLADINEGQIDVVVVYKVDRLTRSLADFAKMVEVFDARAVSFVAVTQQFNTTTSMGRLTLNVLLSFAQFEREVTGERIRDKIAASKKKGMWMGGMPPLGYDVQNRKLVVNDAEARIVVEIFRRYLALKSVHALRDELADCGIKSKRRMRPGGAEYGGQTFSRGALYLILQNRLYRGEIAHKGNSYPGEHPAIVDKLLCDDVQAVLAANRVERTTGARASNPSLLTGMVFDETGERLTPTHAVKKGTRYRYYVSTSLITGAGRTRSSGRRIPAGNLEGLVINRLRTFLADPGAILDAVDGDSHNGSGRSQLIECGRQLAEDLGGLAPDTVKATLRTLLCLVEIRSDRVEIAISRSRLTELLAGSLDLKMPHQAPTSALDDLLGLTVPVGLKRVGREMRMLVENADDQTPADPSLLRILARAHHIQARLIQNPKLTVHDIAREEQVSAAYLYSLLRLPWLAPDITTAIINGRKPPQLTTQTLMRLTPRLPAGWAEQRKLLGFR
jgi:site-specific DNA recombinase